MFSQVLGCFEMQIKFRVNLFLKEMKIFTNLRRFLGYLQHGSAQKC